MYALPTVCTTKEVAAETRSFRKVLRVYSKESRGFSTVVLSKIEFPIALCYSILVKWILNNFEENLVEIAFPYVPGM